MILVRSLFVLWLPGLWILLVVIRHKHRIRDATLVHPGCSYDDVTLVDTKLRCGWIDSCPWELRDQSHCWAGYCDEALAGGGDWQHAPEQRLRQAMRDNETFNALPNDVARELMLVDESKRLVRAWIADHVQELPRLFMARVVTHWNPLYREEFSLAVVGVGWCDLLGFSNAARRPWVLLGLPVMNTVLVGFVVHDRRPIFGPALWYPVYAISHRRCGVG